MRNLFEQLQQAGLADALGEAVFAHEALLDNTALSVKLGDWPLPLDGPGLTEAELARIQAAAHPTPFGWGEQTMFDKAVRDSWEIDAADLEIAWQAGTQAALADELARALCLPPERPLQLSPHKLLLYRSGQFFKPHTDSEKAPGMLATLVIILPAAHQGGVLRVEHGRQAQEFDSSAQSPGQLRLFAFYADCPHQVLPLQSGARVALTFNLCLPAAEQMAAAQSLHAPPQLAAALADYLQQRNGVASVMLSHRYSRDGLQWSLLKGRDIALAQCMLATARAAGWRIFLCQTSLASDYELDGGEEESQPWDEFYPSFCIDRQAWFLHWRDETGAALPEWCMYFPYATPLACNMDRWDLDDHATFAGWSGNRGQIVRGWYRGAALLMLRGDRMPTSVALHEAWRERNAVRSTLQQAEWEHRLLNMLSPYKAGFSSDEGYAPALILLQLALTLQDEQTAAAVLRFIDFYRIPAQAIPEFLRLRASRGDDFVANHIGFCHNMSDIYPPPSPGIDQNLQCLKQAGMPSAQLAMLLKNAICGCTEYAKAALDDAQQFDMQRVAGEDLADWRSSFQALGAGVASCCRAAHRLHAPQEIEALFALILHKSGPWLLEFAEAWVQAFADAGPLSNPWLAQQRTLYQKLQSLDATLAQHSLHIPLRLRCPVAGTECGQDCDECSALAEFATSANNKMLLKTTPMKAAHIVDQIAFYRLPIRTNLSENGRNSRFWLHKTPQLKQDLAQRRKRWQACLAALR